MDPLTIEGSAKTPSVTFDASTGTLAIRGRSIPENSVEFYKPLIDWIDRYARAPQGKTLISVQLEYFNTSSSKCILDVFKKLELVRTAGHEISVQWHYEAEDEDMLEAGEDYQAIINIPFRMVQIAEANGTE
jgi:SiaC family regulatory phosphoprotein